MADGSDEPAIVDSMVALAREGADVVAASRYMRGGHQIGGPPLKRLMSRTAGLTLHWFAGVPTHDPTNNFKLYARRFLDAVTIESTAGFELALELTVKATLDGRTVAEVPTTWRDRTAGQSNFKLRKWLPHYLRLVPTGVRRSLAAAATDGPRDDRALPARARADRPASLVRRDRSLWIAKPDVLGIDARHYQRAASTWLAGGDPWSVTESGIPYAAGPHTLLFYAPTSVLPLDVSTWLWLLVGVVAAVWLVRRLELPLWWLAFPPLLHGVWNGNPADDRAGAARAGQPGRRGRGGRTQAVRRDPAARAAGAHLVIALAVLAVVTLVLPWQLYLDRGLGVGSHLQTAWNGSAWRFPILVIPTLVALWILRRQGAEWFAVPAVFPATQFYYVAMALPALVGRPIVAALLALPVVLMTPLVVIGLAVVELADRRGMGIGPLRSWTHARDRGALDQPPPRLREDFGRDVAD